MSDGSDGSGRLDDDRAQVGETDDSVGDSPANEAAPEPTDRRSATPRGGLDAETLDAYTTERRSLDPTVRLQWAIRTTIGAVVLGLITGAILSSFNVDPVFGSVAMVGFLVFGMGWVLLRYRVWVYQIRDDSVYLERGVVTHVRTIVPYVRIQHVDTSRSALERALGLSTLVVYTAGSRGADVSIPGLEPDQARDLQQRLKELAIEAEGDDAL